MAPHVTEMELDLYLDGGLEPKEHRAIQAHLAACAACQQRLEAVRPLFYALEGLAVPVPEGFVRETMARLEPSAARRERRLARLALVLEGVAALFLLAMLLNRFGALIPLPPAGWLERGVERLAAALQARSDTLHQAAADLLADLSAAASSAPDLLPFHLTAAQMGLLLFITVAALLVGNSLLLRNAALNGNGLRQEA